MTANRFRVSGLLAGRLEERKIRLPAVLEAAGLPAGFFEQEKIFVTTDELFGLWRAIAEVSGDPVIGLTLGGDSRIERHDPPRSRRCAVRPSETRWGAWPGTSSSPVRRRSA